MNGTDSRSLALCLSDSLKFLITSALFSRGLETNSRSFVALEKNEKEAVKMTVELVTPFPWWMLYDVATQLMSLACMHVTSMEYHVTESIAQC